MKYCHRLFEALKYIFPFVIGFVSVFILFSHVHANYDGDLDETFDNGKFVGANSNITASATQSDGKVLVGGWFSEYNNEPVNCLIRINTDGSLDSAFTFGDGITVSGGIYDIVLQDDGKILVAGSLSAYDMNYILRLNSDGSLDSSFSQTGTGFDATVSDIAVQEDGKIVVLGGFSSYNGTAVSKIARLNSDGSLDTTFALEGTGFNNGVLTVALQSDGKILVGGYFNGYNMTSVNRIARLNSDGSLDSSFPGTGFNAQVEKIYVKSDGKILVGGYFDTYNGESAPRLAQLNSDGSLDEEFSVMGTGIDGGVWDIVTQEDGKFLISGDFIDYNGTSEKGIMRLESDGSLDTSFSGQVWNGNVATLSILDDGNIFIGGNFQVYGNYSVRNLVVLDEYGDVDSSFNVGDGFSGDVYAVELLSDGKILVGGNFGTYDNSKNQYLVKLNSDGTLDTEFSLAGTGLDSYVEALVIQSDGKILVGGSFTGYNGESSPGLVRLNSDGSLDTTFSLAGDGYTPWVTTIEVQNDGKILVAGEFDEYGETAVYNLVRLNSDGSLDTTFSNSGNGVDNNVDSLAIQGDGKILVGGYFTQYFKDGEAYGANHILRLNEDGSFDSDFSSHGGTGLDENASVNAITVQSDGKILIGGSFYEFDGSTISNLLRLNSDGSLDTNFVLDGYGFSNGVEVIKIQDDEKILVGGWITYYNTTSTPYLTRLNTDGSLDTGFAQDGTGLNYGVYDMAIQNDGKIIIVGSFTSYNTEDVAFVTRLNIHHTPLAPNTLRFNNTTNPTSVSDTTPDFSALLSDAKSTDQLLSYQIQVSTSTSFTSGNVVWNSGKKAFSTAVTSGNRTGNIPYGGSALTTNGTRYYWRIRVWDTLDEVSAWSSTANFTMASFSLLTPTGLTITPSEYTNTNSYTVTWNAGNTRVVGYEYKIGNGGWIATSNTTLTVLAYKEGQNVIQVRSIDNAGNRSTANTVYYYFDDISPSVPTNLTPTPATSSNNSFGFTWTASTDNESGVYGYEYKVGDSAVWTTVIATSLSNISATQEGENIVYIRASDRAGNISSAASITFYFTGDLTNEDDSNDVISVIRTGQSNTIQNNVVAVKGGDTVTMTIPVEEVMVDGDQVSRIYVEINGTQTELTLNNEATAYEAQVIIPVGKSKGSILPVKQVVEYSSGEQSVKGASIVIDPYGYVFTVRNGQEQILENAKVSLYKYTDGQKTLVSFTDGTNNPQYTNSDGEYSYFVDPGQYQLIVELEGYDTYTSDIFEVKDGAVEINVELEKDIPILLYASAGTFGFLCIILIVVLVSKKKQKTN